jgi:hypothetical protein
MSEFSSSDVMVTVLPEGDVAEISWDGIQACTTPTKGTCTTCTNKSTSTKKTKSAARELALLKAQLRSIR